MAAVGDERRNPDVAGVNQRYRVWVREIYEEIETRNKSNQSKRAL